MFMDIYRIILCAATLQFGSIRLTLNKGVGAAAAEVAMAASIFASNNVFSMASEVAEPPTLYYHTEKGHPTIYELPTPLIYTFIR